MPIKKIKKKLLKKKPNQLYPRRTPSRSHHTPPPMTPHITQATPSPFLFSISLNHLQPPSHATPPPCHPRPRRRHVVSPVPTSVRLSSLPRQTTSTPTVMGYHR